MDNFDFAFSFMAPHEWNQRKNLTNDPADPGGLTKYGITLKSFHGMGSINDFDGDGDVDGDDLRMLDEPTAKTRYRAHYWRFDGIRDMRVAAKVFDLAVNLGPVRAVEYLQQACNVEGYKLTVDGALGPFSLEAVNKASQDAILSHLCAFQRAHYCAWIARKPEREKFRNGLIARALEVPRG